MKALGTIITLMLLQGSNIAIAQSTLASQGSVDITLTEAHNCSPPLANIKGIRIQGSYQYHQGTGFLTINQINGQSITPLTLEPLGLAGKHAFGYFTPTPLNAPGIPNTTLKALYVDLSLLGIPSGNIVFTNKNSSVCQISSANFIK